MLWMVCILVGAPSAAYALETLWYSGASYNAGGVANYFEDADTKFQVFQWFEVLDFEGWHVQTVFVESLLYDDPLPTQAEWSLRRDMAVQDGGIVEYGGIAPITVVPTGRFYDPTPELPESPPPVPEYRLSVQLDLVLPKDTFWLQVTPIGSTAVISKTLGADGVGQPIGEAGTTLWWWASGFHVYDIREGAYAMGVTGSVVPEAHASLASVATCATLAWVRVRRTRRAGRQTMDASARAFGAISMRVWARGGAWR